MSIEVVGLGALNIDHIYKVERILDDGEAVVKDSMPFPGGSAANTIYGLAKLGVSTGFTGVIGDDAEGKSLLQDFQTVGVDTSQIRLKPEAKTGSVLCLSDELLKRSLYVSPGANNLLAIDDLDLTYINQARLLHISSFADDRQFKVLLEIMDKLDSSIKVSFSPGALYATKGLRSLSPILAKTYVLFLNQREIKQLTGHDFREGAEICLNWGCRMVVVTLGSGLEPEIQHEVPRRRRVPVVGYIRDAEGEYVIEPESQRIAPVVDTTGAGDAFATGFIYGLLKEKGIEECGLLADITARLSTAKTGARQGLPTLNELSHRYRELYNKQL